MKTTVQEACGYVRKYTSYGIGYPGYYVEIVRGTDGQRMFSGPFVNGEPYRHPDWLALPPQERERIVAALHAAEAKQ